MREAIGTGDTVELAKEAACKELGIESYEAEFEILEMPTRKTFGIFGGSPAKVRVYLNDDPADAAAAYLKNVLSCMGVSGASVDIRRKEDGALLVLDGQDIGFVIGHRGETLDSLQYLAGLVANHIGGSYYRIALDIGNYREKRRRTLESLGRKMAEKSLRTGHNLSLEPMNPYERRIIHTSVQQVEGARSWSEGENMERHVVIGPVGGERYPRRGYGTGRHSPSKRRPSGRPVPRQKYAGSGERPSVPESRPVFPEAKTVPEGEKAKADTEGPLYEKVEPK
jgi:spoIIIJ-associated protein